MAQIEVPLNAISPDTLRRIIEEFVLQEGTDYGSGDYSLEQKVEQVRKQIAQGKAFLLYDDETETCGIYSNSAKAAS